MKTVIAIPCMDTVQTEFFLKAIVGLGTIVSNLKDLARSYKEAQVAIEVGKVFDDDKHIIPLSRTD